MRRSAQDDIVTSKLDLGAGSIAVPDGPGLGVTLDEEKVARYAYRGQEAVNA